MRESLVYEGESFTLQLVPMGDASCSPAQAQTALNDIYQQAAVTWQVSAYQKDFNPTGWDEDEDGLVKSAETQFLSNYTSEMNNIISAFKKQANPDRKTYYLFLVPGFSDDLAGFMPLGRNYGFIATGNATTIANIIGHELGHGAFVLYHPFSDKSPYYRPEGSTDNLMDYSGGTFLNKYQWDYIHDPRRIVRVAQDEGEGELVNNEAKIKEILELLHNANFDNEKKLDLTSYGTGVLKGEKVKLGNDKEYELVLVLKYKNGKNEINPKNYGINFKDYAMAREGKFTAFELYTSFNKTFEIIVEDEFAGTLETYLFNDTILKVNVVTTLIEENEKNTFSSFSIDKDEVAGYFIEPEGGTNTEERTAGSGKRIPPATYEVIEDPCKTGRSNCANEFRLITTTEKSGTRSAILIHTGVDYNHTTGCFITAGDNYETEEFELKNPETGETIKTINIYNTNGTSTITLNAINTYIVKKKKEAEKKDKTLKINLTINR